MLLLLFAAAILIWPSSGRYDVVAGAPGRRRAAPNIHTQTRVAHRAGGTRRG